MNKKCHWMKIVSMTIGEDGKEVFITGGTLGYIHKSVELEQLAFYFDSDIKPWEIGKPWKDLLLSKGIQDMSNLEALEDHPGN